MISADFELGMSVWLAGGAGGALGSSIGADLVPENMAESCCCCAGSATEVWASGVPTLRQLTYTPASVREQTIAPILTIADRVFMVSCSLSGKQGS
jgi:hypothetical protein